MALEHDIQDLTAAIHLLHQTLHQTLMATHAPTTPTGKKEAPPAEVTPPPEAPPKKPKAATTPKSSPASAPTPEPSSEDSGTPVIEFEDVQQAVLEVSKKSRDDKEKSREQAVALLHRFGALNSDGKPAISAIKTEFFAEVMKLCPRIMSGEVDMTAAVDEI